MPTAIIRPISPKMGNCELTHYQRQPIDIEKAKEQHEDYIEALQLLVCKVIQAEAAPDLPDSVFVEDCAVVLDELAITTHPGAESRRAEVEGVAAALKPFKELRSVESPSVLDGGDVLVIGKQIWVGLSSRSNEEAIRQMKQIVEPHGYEVIGVEVTGCLHLKSAVTQVGEGMVLLNPEWVNPTIYSAFKIIETHPGEPGAANGLLVNGSVIYSAEFPLTAMRLAEAGVEVLLVDNSEVIKAEGAVTCCSLIFE